MDSSDTSGQLNRPIATERPVLMYTYRGHTSCKNRGQEFALIVGWTLVAFIGVRGALDVLYLDTRSKRTMRRVSSNNGPASPGWQSFCEIVSRTVILRVFPPCM